MKKLFIVCSFLLILSCEKSSFNIPETQEEQNQSMLKANGFAENNMVMYWNEKAASVLVNHRNPGDDSRFFAIIQIAVHDALNNIKPKYECYALLNEREQFANADAAVASAAYWAIKGLNLQGNFPVETWYEESLATVSDGQNKDLGIALGKKSANAIIANRANDGRSQVILASTSPPDGINPGEFQPTLPVSNPDLNLPHLKFLSNWGIVVRPFATQSNYQFRPPGPYPVNSDEYTVDYNEVKSKGSLVNSTRTQEEHELAVFWSDIRQHVVWNEFTRKIIFTKKIDAWKTARLFALIHTSMADGASAMFESSYHFYYWRPETAIRFTDDNNPNTVSDPEWLPGIMAGLPQADPRFNVYTPRIPEYTTIGTISGASGEILKSFFGDNISIEMKSATLPNVTLPYTSISKAVEDYTISKIYCGWSFRKSGIDGMEQGRQIANYVLNNRFREE